MVLPIFPEGGLTSSVITTVWVGVFVLAFFNLRFGWVLSGLVVPGYIVPLLILRPLAALVIVIEAVITYLIVLWFSERFARGRFNALFGRDRFMGLVLASIAVRAGLDGWALPHVADWLSQNWDRQIDWHSNLQSFGLVVVSLMANQFWKPGLARGLFSAAVVTGLTWLIVRYGLMEFTNFRLSGVTYVYEGLASSILASPKAYMILVLTAFIASQMNVRYGWDFSGILIPALIALQWYQPYKILSSFVEAGVIYVLAQAVMRIPLFASMTIEGARKLVLFFNVSFVYKVLLGHLLNLLALDVKTTDFYGFGYLLSTLLAIKAYDKHIFPRVMRSTLEVSIAGAAAGNLVGFLLMLLLPAQSAQGIVEPGKREDEPTGTLVAAAVGDAHLQAAGLRSPPLSNAEAGSLGDALDLLASGARPDYVAAGLSGTAFRLSLGEDGLAAIARRSGSGRDLVLLNPAARRNIVVIVRDAGAAPGLGAAALALFRGQDARWLVLAAPSPADADPEDRFAEVVAGALRLPVLDIGQSGGANNRMVASGSATAALDLGALQSAVHGLTLAFDAGGAANRAQLMLDDRALEQLAASDPLPAIEPDCALVAASTAQPMPPPAKPDLASLAFLRFEIAAPLAAAQRARAPMPEVARRNSAMAGWTLDRCLLDGRNQWRLSHPGGVQGTYLIAPGGDPTRLVESHLTGARLLEASRAVAARWNAGALLLATDETQLIGDQRSTFGTIAQQVVRAQGVSGGQLLQLRTAPADTLPAGPQGDLAVVPDLLEPASAWDDAVGGLVREAGYRPLIVDRSSETAGLEIAPNYAVRYLSQTQGWRYATLWLLNLGRSGSAPAAATASPETSHG